MLKDFQYLNCQPPQLQILIRLNFWSWLKIYARFFKSKLKRMNIFIWRSTKTVSSLRLQMLRKQSYGTTQESFTSAAGNKMNRAKAKRLEKVFSTSQTNITTRGSFIMVRKMVQELWCNKMEIFIKVNGKAVKSMDKGNFYKRVLESSTKDNGKMGKKMGKELKKLQKVNFMTEHL